MFNCECKKQNTYELVSNKKYNPYAMLHEPYEVTTKSPLSHFSMQRLLLGLCLRTRSQAFRAFKAASLDIKFFHKGLLEILGYVVLMWRANMGSLVCIFTLLWT